MATLRDIKNRIKGVKSTQQITKAMKMVAAAKLRRAQESIINARPYAKQITVILKHLVSQDDINANPYLSPREVKNIALVVISADRGLCGAFNTNILKEASRFISDNPDSTVHLFCVGRKSFEFFTKREHKLAGKYTGLFTPLKYESAVNIFEQLEKNYLDGTFDKVYLLYNEFKSIIQQKITVEQYLPVPIKESIEPVKLPDYIFEPSREDIVKYLIPKHLRAQIWRALLESNAAELGARMTAMDNATTNAKELIRILQLTYNKERQAAITKEILEIVSGANALKVS